MNLKPGFLDEKRHSVARKLEQVVGWVRRFNDENESSNRNPLLPAHICGQDNVSLLHAAIFAQDVGLVETLMRMGANPYVHSGVGSAMTLALNQSDSLHKSEAHKTKFEDMIKLMQGQSIPTNSNNNPSYMKENSQGTITKDRKNKKSSSSGAKVQGKNPLVVSRSNTCNVR